MEIHAEGYEGAKEKAREPREFTSYIYQLLLALELSQMAPV